MRQDQLPAPGVYVNSQSLRIEAAKAISHAEIITDLNGGIETDSRTELRKFFEACAAAIPDIPVGP